MENLKEKYLYTISNMKESVARIDSITDKINEIYNFAENYESNIKTMLLDKIENMRIDLSTNVVIASLILNPESEITKKLISEHGEDLFINALNSFNNITNSYDDIVEGMEIIIDRRL